MHRLRSGTKIKMGITLSLPVIALPLLQSIHNEDLKEIRKEKRPNIIYILADDLGYGDLGVYGQNKIETPNIDMLAKNGIRFTDHYSGAPVSAPSRCVLLTGKHLGHAYIRGNDEWTERGDVWDFEKAVENSGLEGQRPLPSGTKTIGNLLQSAGYRTGMVGKWGLGSPDSESTPIKKGFDFFFGYNCQRQAHTYFPKHLWKNDKKVWLNNELVVPGTKLDKDADPYVEESYKRYFLNEYSPDLMQKEAINFINENRNQPFFLYYASPIPHLALQAPKELVEYYVKKFGEEKPYDGSMGYFPVRYPRATYAAMVSYLDSQVGEIIQELKKLGLYENTIIMFSSDNGPTYSGGTDSPWFSSAGPFRSEYGWAKGFVHEGGIRVPMIASWPGRIKGGAETSYISSFYDVLPTLCEITGISVPGDADGKSFLPVLLGRKKTNSLAYYYWEFPEYGGQVAIRMGKWKGIIQNILIENKLKLELYDLENDLTEQTDIASEHPEIVENFYAIIKKEHVQSELKIFRMTQLGDSI